MKRFLLLLAVLSLFAFKTAEAQFIPFSAKAGLPVARQAISDSGYTDVYLVAIHTKWSQQDDTYEYDTVYGGNRWNGLEYSWEFTFHKPSDSTYYSIQVMRNLDSSFLAVNTDLPFDLDTARVPDDAWLDSDENNNAKRFAGWGEITRLFFHTSARYGSEAQNKLVWASAYYYMEDLYVTTMVDAYSGELIFREIIGSVNSDSQNGLSVFPNPSSSGVTVKSDNFCSQFEMMNIFMSSGKKVGTVLCSPNAEQLTIPASTFPANGQYFLKFSGKKNSVTLPVTIQGK